MARPIHRPSNAEAREYCERWNVPSWQGAGGKASPNLEEYKRLYGALNARDLRWEIQRRDPDYRCMYAEWKAGGLRDQYAHLVSPDTPSADLPPRASYPHQREIGGTNIDRAAMSKTDLMRMMSLPLVEQEAFGRRWAEAQAEDHERRGLSLVTLVINPAEGLTAHMDDANLAITKALRGVQVKTPSAKKTPDYVSLMVLDGYGMIDEGLGLSPAYIGEMSTHEVGDDGMTVGNASAAARIHKAALNLLDRI